MTLSPQKKRLLNKYNSALGKADLAALIEQGGSGGAGGNYSHTWFVDVNANVNGDGSVGSPFNSFAAVNAVVGFYETVIIMGGIDIDFSTSPPSFSNYLTELPLKAGNNYICLAPILLNGRMTIEPNLSTGFTSFTCPLMFVVGAGLDPSTPWFEVPNNTFLSVDIMMMMMIGFDAFDSIIHIGPGNRSDLLFNNTTLSAQGDNATLFFCEDNSTSINFIGTRTQVYVEDAIAFKMTGGSVMFDGGNYGNHSNTLPSVVLEGSGYCNLIRGYVENFGSAPAISLRNACTLNVYDGAGVLSNGSNCINRDESSGIGTIRLSPCSSQALGVSSATSLDLATDTQIGYVTTSPIGTSLGALTGQVLTVFAPPGGPHLRYMCTGGTTWIQI